MKPNIPIAELLALAAIVDERLGRSFADIDPPRFLREIQEKLDTIVLKHVRTDAPSRTKE